MITYTTGDIFKANTEALVNPVNCVGVMGKGLALEFKRRFQKNFQEYKFQCDNDLLEIGEMLITGPYKKIPKYIINFPTKKDWRNPSQIEWIEEGLIALRKTITEYEIESIAIPALGVGNGGLKWSSVKPLMEYRLHDLSSVVNIVVYTPQQIG